MSADAKRPITDLAPREGLPVEWLDEEGLTVSVDHNSDQSLVLIESDSGSRIAAAIDGTGVTVAEAIEAAREIRHAIDRLERDPFADGGDVGR